MRVLKGIIAIIVAAMFGGMVGTSAITDVALVFTDFSWTLVGWSFVACATACGATAGYLYFTQPQE